MASGTRTSLCNHCRMRPPKYKCPRCSRQHCSLECVKRHKKGWHCNGERDPTVFIPAKRLRTDAGIDHDYNFLHKVDRSLEQANKLVEERGLVPQPRPDGRPPQKKPRLHKGKSRGRTNIGGREWPRDALQRLTKKGISVVHLPYGMSRMKENNTSYSKKQRAIHWQVEWILLGTDETSNDVRFLQKTLDETPMHVAFTEAQERHRLSPMSRTERIKDRRHRKELAMADEANLVDNTKQVQNPDTSSWRANPDTIQDMVTGSWRCTTIEERLLEVLAEKHKKKYEFFFLLPGTPSREAKRLFPVKPTDTLCSILSGLSVLEFPTICVLQAGIKIPSGYIRDKRSKAQINDAFSGNFKGDSNLNPKGKKIEVVDGASDDEEYIRGMESDESEGNGPGFEFDDVVKMAEYLEEGEIDKEADTTSSSGTSSDSDMDTD